MWSGSQDGTFRSIYETRTRCSTESRCSPLPSQIRSAFPSWNRIPAGCPHCPSRTVAAPSASRRWARLAHSGLLPSSNPPPTSLSQHVSMPPAPICQRRRSLPHDQPVLIAEPVRWTVEFRFFVVDGTIATGSVYIRDGGLAEAEDGSWPADPEETAAAHNFAARVVADQAAAIPAAVVLDVGQIAGHGMGSG